MSGVFWTDKLSVDDGAIDADHKLLLDISNKFLLSPPSAGLPELREVVGELDHYAKFHFQREEKIQRAIRYLDADIHKRQHEYLIQQLASVSATLSNPKSSMVEAKGQASNLIREWLIMHIARYDLKMVRFRDAMKLHSLELLPLSLDAGAGVRPRPGPSA